MSVIVFIERGAKTCEGHILPGSTQAEPRAVVGVEPQEQQKA